MRKTNLVLIFSAAVILSACVQNYVNSTVEFDWDFPEEQALPIIFAKITEKAEREGAECSVSGHADVLKCHFVAVGDLVSVGAGITKRGKYTVSVRSNAPTHLVVSEERIQDGYLPHKNHAEWEDFIFSEFNEFGPDLKYRSWRDIRLYF